MKVRRLTNDDRANLAAIRLELFPEDSLDGWPAEYYLSEGVTFGAFDGELVGYAAAGFRSHAEGAWERSPSEQRIAYLEEWYVRPGHRGQGVGRALVEAVRSWAISENATHLASDTEIGNENSIRAHLAIGFGEVERTVHFLETLAREA